MLGANFPDVSVPTLSGPDSDFLMKCALTTTTSQPEARFSVTWYADGQPVAVETLTADFPEAYLSVQVLPSSGTSCIVYQIPVCRKTTRSYMRGDAALPTKRKTLRLYYVTCICRKDGIVSQVELGCGTVVPIWMNGTHPTVGEGMVSRTACANFESGEADKEPNFATSDDHNDNADNNDLTNYNDNYDLTNYNLTNDNDNYDLTNYNLTDDNDNYDLTNYDDNYDLTNYNLTNPNDNYDLTTYNNYDLTTTNNHDITNASNYNDNANHFASYFNYNPNHSNGEYDKCNGDPHNTSSSEVFLVLHVR
nr:hypothetical protein BaRGS_018618 [Batillaria attramentaria]